MHVCMHLLIYLFINFTNGFFAQKTNKLFLLMLGVLILDPAWGAAKNNDVFKVK